MNLPHGGGGSSEGEGGFGVQGRGFGVQGQGQSGKHLPFHQAQGIDEGFGHYPLFPASGSLGEVNEAKPH